MPGLSNNLQLIETVRCHFSKEFFTAIQRVARFRPSSVIARRFGDSDQSFGDYLSRLYWNSDHEPPPSFDPEPLMISMAQFEEAVSQLSSGKAVGRDKMPDLMLKKTLTLVDRDMTVNPRRYSVTAQLKQKLLRAF